MTRLRTTLISVGAGATLVAIGTAGMVDPRVPERIVRDLERHGIDG